MRIVHACIVVTATFLLACPAVASEHIRVLLLQGISEVEVSADRTMTLTLPSERARELNSRVRVTHGPTGLRVNGEATRGGRITISSRATELIVTGASAVVPVGGVVQIVDFNTLPLWQAGAYIGGATGCALVWFSTYFKTRGLVRRERDT